MTLEVSRPEAKTKKIRVGQQELVFETGRIARQAGGAVTLTSGDNMVLATACRSSEPKDCDFLPLMVIYSEKFSSVGKTAGGFIKREGRPTQRETLISRLIDRPIRPLFPEGYHYETQVIATVMSYDGSSSIDVLGLCAASAALAISDVPFTKPVAGVRVGMIDDQWVINPTHEEMEKSQLDLLLAGTDDAILMIEGYCDFLTEDQIVSAIEAGHAAIGEICAGIVAFAAEFGKEKQKDCCHIIPEETKSEVARIATPLLEPAVRIREKQERNEAMNAAKEAVFAELAPAGEETPKHSSSDLAAAFKKLSAHVMRKMVLDEGVRVDGRSTTDVRQITIEQSLLPRTHGSSLFTRGETQAIAVCTLGSEAMAQRYETVREQSSERFYLQYFFPPYSVGEAGRVGPAGRREVGHGKLAERALQYALPSQEEFPYVIRLESNITESNGSSSMASVCGGCLAMMDAGVPIKRPVAGVAMGLILEGEQSCVLTDILGLEDALGDMDFKITGDKEGVTAFQMDIKVEGITPQIMRQALEQARDGRIHILNEMVAACPESNKTMSKYAPRIEVLKIAPSKIGTVIGPGGKQIRAIVEETGVEVNIDDDGTVNLSSNDAQSLEKAKEIIHGLTAEVEIGATYKGRKVTSVVDFGIFVEVLPGKEGLCHISELDSKRVEDIRAFMKDLGDEVDVKVVDINERGQLKLSRKVLLEK